MRIGSRLKRGVREKEKYRGNEGEIKEKRKIGKEKKGIADMIRIDAVAWKTE